MRDELNRETKLAGLTLDRATGEPVQLADLWRKRPVVLVWIRHFG